MSTSPILRYLVAGSLRRNTIITPQHKVAIDVSGGSALYAAVGLSIWESGVGLIARIGENYPQEWLTEAAARGLDLRGVRILQEEIDLRTFVAYSEDNIAMYDNPVTHFGRLELPYPKTLLGYTPPEAQIDSRSRPSLLTIRKSDLPSDYLDATAAHLCPHDYLSHTLLPSTLRQGHISTLTLDPGEGYMDPAFWDDIPILVNGLTGFLCSERKLNNLFQGRPADLWEMAETIASYGCEIVVIKRGGAGQAVYNAQTHARLLIPAYPVQVADPTGAGDAFCGGFLAGYRDSYDPLYATLTGSISASMVLEGLNPFYALDALPTLSKARLEALRDRVRKV